MHLSGVPEPEENPPGGTATAAGPLRGQSDLPGDPGRAAGAQAERDRREQAVHAGEEQGGLVRGRVGDRIDLGDVI